MKAPVPNIFLASLLLCAGINAFAPGGTVVTIRTPVVAASSPESWARHVLNPNSESTVSLSLSATSEEQTETKILADEELDVFTLLDGALNTDVTSVTKLLDEINKLRQSEAQDELENFLDNILALVDDNEKKPFWTKVRITSKISRRSRRAALSRVLDMSTPAASDEEDTEAAQQSRRRRAFVVALRSLVISSSSGNEEKEGKDLEGVSIYSIEKAARRDAKEQTSAQDWDSRLPPGLETPKYDVIVKRPKQRYEIRDYEPFSVCSVPMSVARPDAQATDRKVSQPQLKGASSFGALAGYLFGKNEDQVAMKMTTPVLTTGEGENKEMSFVLPSTYWGDEENLSKAPSPLENSLVQLKRIDGKKRAVHIFGGFASSKEAEKKKKELMTNLESDQDWVPVSGELTVVAQYNDPFTPPWKRRNEVSVLVEPRNK